MKRNEAIYNILAHTPLLHSSVEINNTTAKGILDIPETAIGAYTYTTVAARIWLDGTAPLPTEGFPIASDTLLTLVSRAELEGLRIITQSGDGKAFFMFFS